MKLIHLVTIHHMHIEFKLKCHGSRWKQVETGESRW
jgi:hypothetical protein